MGLSQALILSIPQVGPRAPHCRQTSLGPFQYASLSGYDPFPSVGARMKRPEFLGFLGDLAALVWLCHQRSSRVPTR